MKKFKPFEQVLVYWTDVWTCDLYSHYDAAHKSHITITGLEFDDDEIIQYANNEHLVGTSETNEEIDLSPGEWLLCTDEVENIPAPVVLTKFVGITDDSFCTQVKTEDKQSSYRYAMRLSEVVNVSDETSLNILCVKDGQIVRKY